MAETRIVIEPGGPRPPFYLVAQYLWGTADFDSDGNSTVPESVDWTELTLTNRQDPSQRVDVDPIADEPLQLEVRSTSHELARAVADFLARETKGTLIVSATEASPEVHRDPSGLDLAASPE